MRYKSTYVLILFMIICLLSACNLYEKEPDLTSVPSTVVELAPTPTPKTNTKKIGISMPAQTHKYWELSGNRMRQLLEENGFEVDLQYADNDVALQAYQIENMIKNDCKILVIAPIDGRSLSTTLSDAEEKNISVIAYRRFIWDTKAVTHYVAFDTWQASTIKGQYIIDQLYLEKNDGPFNIELFTGDPGDSNFCVTYGALEVLQPYFDSGKLVCLSGQTMPIQIATEAWSTEKARERMENLIETNNYGPNKTKLDAVLCIYDSLAQGVTQALLDAGYSADNFPIITGEGCDIQSVKNIISGTQSMSVFYAPNILADRAVQMVISLSKGEEPIVNTTTTDYFSGRVIPTYICDPAVVTKENYRDILIESGYYTEEEIYH